MSQITDTIYRQITIGTKMACGARDFVAGDYCPLDGNCKGMPFLWFRVGSGSKLRKIIVAYDGGADAYNLMHIEISRRSLETAVREQAEEVYVDELNSTIYRMVNK